jgi:Domain of unknown function (DUF4407)
MNAPTPTSKEPGLVQRILWWASGATSAVLQDCPTEHRKYSAIGAAMLAIPVVASLGAGFALYQSYENLAVAIAGGIGWGVLIFIVDRLIQISIRKAEKGRKAFWMALPRLLMILVLSFLITDPLLHKLFESDINAELSRQVQLAAANAQTVAETRYGKEIEDLEKTNQSLNESANRLKGERDRKFDEWMAEGAGTGGTRVRGKGLLYREKQLAYQKADEEYQKLKRQLDPQIEQNETRIRDLRKVQDREVTQVTTDQSKARGLLARNSALWIIIKRDPGAAMVAIMLMLALMLLESTPLTIKLMSARGTYEKRFDRVEDEQFFAEELLLEESKQVLRQEKEARLHFSDAMDRAVKQQLARVANAINTNGKNSLDEDLKELFNHFSAELNKRFSKNLPRSTAQPQTNYSSKPQLSGSPASLLVRLSEPENRTFCLNINRPDSEVTGQDLLYALRGVEESLLPPNPNQPPLSVYRVVNDAGAEIEPREFLFTQLHGARSVNLVLPAQNVSDAEQ